MASIEDEVGGVGDGDLHDAVVLAQGDEREAVDELDREGLDEIAVEVLGLEVDVGDAVALGQSADVPVAAVPSYPCSRRRASPPAHRAIRMILKIGM